VVLRRRWSRARWCRPRCTDEPTTGWIRGARGGMGSSTGCGAEGLGIVLTTHYMTRPSG
jgi:hypothetical protein